MRQARQKNASSVNVTYLGVQRCGGRWSAVLTSRSLDVQLPLGVFDSATEAAAAYDEVQCKFFVCLPACLLACLLAYLLACMLVCLFVCLLAGLLACARMAGLLVCWLH